MSKLGKRLLAHTIHFKQFPRLAGYGINKKHFIGGTQQVYTYIKNKVKKGSYPSLLAIREHFGISFDVDTEKPEDIEYLVELMKKRFVTNQMNPHIMRAINCIEERKVQDAFDEIKKLIPYQRELNTNYDDGIHKFKEHGLERVEDYLEIKAGEFKGLPTPWPTLNNVLGGWLNEILHVVVGLTSVGKSWITSVICERASKCVGKFGNILLVTTEMSPKRLAKRIDCVKQKIPFRDLRDGSLSDEAEEKWGESVEVALEDEADYGEIHIVGRQVAKTVDDILLLVGEYQPSLVCVDGGYRLHPTAGGDWGGQVQVIEELQEAVQLTKIPWVVTSQLGDSNQKKRDRAKGKKINSWNVRYAKEWLINPDVVLGIRQDELLKMRQLMEMDILKHRDGDGDQKHFNITWNPKKMEYEEVPESELAERLDGAEDIDVDKDGVMADGRVDYE